MEGNLFEGTLNIFVPIFIITWLCKFFSKLMHINLFGKILNWDCLFDIYILIHLIQFNPIGILSNSKIILQRYYIYQQLFEKSIDTINNSFFLCFLLLYLLFIIVFGFYFDPCISIIFHIYFRNFCEIIFILSYEIFQQNLIFLQFYDNYFGGNF